MAPLFSIILWLTQSYIHPSLTHTNSSAPIVSSPLSFFLASNPLHEILGSWGVQGMSSVSPMIITQGNLLAHDSIRQLPVKHQFRCLSSSATSVTTAILTVKRCLHRSSGILCAESDTSFLYSSVFLGSSPVLWDILRCAYLSSNIKYAMTISHPVIVEGIHSIPTCFCYYLKYCNLSAQLPLKYMGR